MDRLRLPEDQPIEANMVSKAIERAQRQVESQNFEIRKNVLKYDEVMNVQRERVYEWRRSILEGTAGDDLIGDWIDSVVTDVVETELSADVPKANWDWEALSRELMQYYPTEITEDRVPAPVTIDSVIDFVGDEAAAAYDRREEELGPEVLRQVERSVMLSVIDNKWREHLSEMDYLRAGIGLRAMGQRDPLSEYQREAYDMFAEMVDSVKRDTVRYLFHVELAQPKTAPQRVAPDPTGNGQRKPVSVSDKIGRNDPCPCGSGKKYKRCHGAA
jgi:preprotein translocase subunit SecA